MLESPLSGSSTAYAAALSTASDPGDVYDDLCQALAGPLATQQRPPDLACVFASHHHRPHWAAVNERWRQRTQTGHMLGCLGQAIVGCDAQGRGREIEEGPAWSVWLGWLPRSTRITVAHLSLEQTSEGLAFTGFEGDFAEQATVILLADPFSFPADGLLERWREDRPGTLVVGGMASGGAVPGENRLVLDARTFDHGAVAVALDQGPAVNVVLSQGCRPIGQPFIVTRSERNVIFELGGQPALAQLQKLFNELPNQEKELLRRGLHLGRVVSEYRDRFEPGDFLVRNVVGLDSQHQALVIGDFIRTGQTVQFHLRDADSADRDLHLFLQEANRQLPSAAAGLVFTCNGRGQHLFGQADHDVSVVQQQYGAIPLAGFFAQGEIGPVHKQNYLHGFTASIALFGG